MDTFKQKEKVLKKKSKIYFWMALLFFLVSIIFFLWFYTIEEEQKNSKVTLHDKISNQDYQEEKVVSLTVVEKPFLFAEYDDDEKSAKYYFLQDENYLYIGYLDYSTYLELNQDNISINPITIKGLTKIIPEDVKEIAIEVYNEKLEEDFLTKENFEEYIGLICIDTESSWTYSLWQMVLGIVFLIESIVLMIIYGLRMKKWKAIKKSMMWDNLKNELSKENCQNYEKLHLYLTENYIVDGNGELVVIPYQDIVWLYPYEQKYNGITNSSCLIVVTKDKKKIKIATVSGFHLKLNKIYPEIMQFIDQKNSSVLIGFTKENQQKIKDLYQIQ